MQIHELPTLPSADGSEYMAVDTGSATYKMRTLFGAIASNVLKIFGSLIVNSGLGTGGKTASNDTTHAGAWLTPSGEVHISRSASSGGYIGFHYNYASSPTTSLNEATSGVLTCSGQFFSKSYDGTSRPAINTDFTDGKRVSHLSCYDDSQVAVYGQWGATGTTYSAKYVATGASDIRLKENIRDCEVENALDVINQINLHSFDWISSGQHQKIGMIADELESLDSRLTLGGGTEEDGSINCKCIDTFYLIGYLVKAVQELSAEVEMLRG